MSQEPESEKQYFAESAHYGIIALKCHDGRFYFIKHKKSAQVMNKSLDLSYLTRIMEEMENAR